jgi:hypothetical protein
MSLRMTTFTIALIVGLLAAYYFTQVRAPWTFIHDPKSHHEGSEAYAGNGRDYSKLVRSNGIKDNRLKVWDKTCNNHRAGAVAISARGIPMYVMDWNGCRPGGNHEDGNRNFVSHRTGDRIDDPYIGVLHNTGGTSRHPN